MNTTSKFLLALLMQTVFCISNLYGQCNPRFFKTPEELVRNRLTGDEKIYGHPYTMFNKRYTGFNLDSEIAYIRKQIQDESKLPNKGPVYLAYTDIFDLANNSRPDDYISDETDDYSKLAVWAKYNAFVLLIGLNATGGKVDRNEFVARVEDGFEHMDYEAADDLGDVINFANSAICWIQAYDLYKTYLISTNPDNLSSDFDRNRSDCGARDKMRMMAHILYKNGWGDIIGWGPVNHPSGWKKNHGVIAASAMAIYSVI
jgi:hypothetical protein